LGPHRVSFSRKLVLGAAGIGSAVLLAITVGVVPAFGSNSSSQWVGNSSFETATIPLHQTSVTIALGGSFHLDASSVAVCTFQSDPGGRDISYAKVNYAKNTVTVYLNGAAPKAIKVACITTPVSPGSISGPVSGPVTGP
jgi:hypothetical protein